MGRHTDLFLSVLFASEAELTLLVVHPFGTNRAAETRDFIPHPSHLALGGPNFIKGGRANK
jgi:hypothetical protein